MITLEKIIEMVSSTTTKSTPKKLPNYISKYTQKSAVDIRKEELESVRQIDETMSQFVDFTMDSELKEYAANKETQQKTMISDTVCMTVPNHCLITYIENSIATTPSVVLDIFKKCKMNPDNWYIYGFKNPESLCKSFLMLTMPDFMLKNKNDRRNDVLTLKREMAINLDTFFKKLGYRFLKFNRTEMMDSLMNKDNYNSFDFLTLAADYYQADFLIIDIINARYIDVVHTHHKLAGGQSDINNNTVSGSGDALVSTQSSYMIIIRYTNNTYLPLMTPLNGKYHYVPQEFVDIIKKSYEREPVEPKFRYKSDITQDSRKDTTVSDNTNNTKDTKEPQQPTEITIELKPSPSRQTIIQPNVDTVLSELIKVIPMQNTEKSDAIDVNTSGEKSTDIFTLSVDEINKKIDKFTLGQLQSMAQSKSITIDKPGKTPGKMIRKTKYELYMAINGDSGVSGVTSPE
jgi:hypothetical protein